jgi:HPt (histidine-containing phosphotransfer) domain-containing protein
MALDQKALDELRALDPDGSAGLVKLIVTSYLTDAQTILSRMRGAFDAGDLVAVTRDAHSLKSSSLSVGAPAVSRAASALEAAGRAGAGADCPALMDTLMREFAQAEPLLMEIIG